MFYLGTADSTTAARTGMAVYEKPADGTGSPRLVAVVPQIPNNVVPLPDAKGVLVESADPTTLLGDILLARFDSGATPTPLLAESYDERLGAISRDGRWLAYVSDESGRAEVYVRPFPDVASGRWQVSVGGGERPRWARDGREIYYLDPAGTLIAAQVETAEGFRVRSQESLFAVQGYRLYDVAPDGRFLVAEPGDAASGNSEVIFVQNFFEELKRMVGR